MISHSNKWTGKPLFSINRAFSGNPKGMVPKNFSGGSLAFSTHSRLALRARAGDCQLLGWIRPCLPYIENSLAFLFNASIETSQFPDSLKVARITPIFKDGDKTEKSNYRPISVLPVISKLFEKLVFNQLYQYMEDNGLFTSDQSGFCAYIPH